MHLLLPTALLQNLIETQNRWRRFMPGFTFYMGFSGMYFLHGNPKEQHGDEALISEFLKPFTLGI